MTLYSLRNTTREPLIFSICFVLYIFTKLIRFYLLLARNYFDALEKTTRILSIWERDETFSFGNVWFHNTYQYLNTDTRSHIFAQPWSVVIGVPEKWESGVKHKFRMRQICSYLRSEINAMEHCFACHVLRGYVVTTLKELEFEFLKPPHGGPEHCYNTTILYPSKRSMEKILPSCHNPVRFSKKIDMNLRKPWTMAE